MTAETEKVPTNTSSLDELRAAVVGLARDVPGPLRRLRLGNGEVTAELEWHPISSGEDQLRQQIDMHFADSEVDSQEKITITAPLVGIFYAAPGPDSPAFVVEGDAIMPGQQVGIIEAMKLLNPVLATVPGHISEIMVANGAAVEFDQPLFALDTTTLSPSDV